VVTAMPQYQTKSFEELRFEDYTGQGEHVMHCYFLVPGGPGGPRGGGVWGGGGSEPTESEEVRLAGAPSPTRPAREEAS
jgi:hypothetical protein